MDFSLFQDFLKDLFENKEIICKTFSKKCRKI